MPKIMQNLVLLIEPPENEYDISLKAGNMCMNRFCIDEDASCELSGVHDLKTPSFKVTDMITAKGKVNYCECVIVRL